MHITLSSNQCPWDIAENTACRSGSACNSAAGLLLPVKHRQPNMCAGTREVQSGYTHGASTSSFDVEAVLSNTDYARDPEVRGGVRGRAQLLH